MSDFEERLKEERVLKGMNQEDFASYCGVRKNAQSNYEKGNRVPDANYLASAARLGCDVQYILTGIRSDNLDAIGKPQLSVVEKPTSLTVKEAVDLVAFATKEGIHTAYAVRKMQDKLFGLKMDAYGSIDLITKAAKLMAHCELTGDSPAAVFDEVINDAIAEDKASNG